tara:strand:- start:1493 stop:1714 length:222 start_codon:yes stop_codon:yes gene_type:complete
MDNMGLHDLLWILVTGLTAFFVRIIWSKLETLDREMKEVSITYVRREDYRDDITEIKIMLGKIFDRLDTKADK